MQITRKHWAAAGIGFVVAVVAVAYHNAKTPVSVLPETATTTPLASGTTTPAVPAGSVQPFPINPADTIVSWSFKGSYTGNETLTKQANADIAHLTGLFGTGKYDDYDLYNGIANDDSFLGDGKGAYQNYNRAISIYPKKGLTYANLAHLMDQLGAYETAADAYTKAVTVEPKMLEYHIERLKYLTRQFASDNTRIAAAFTDASKQFGDAAPILTIEAEWLTQIKRYADAVKAWQTVKMLSPGEDTTAIDAAIAALKAKQ